MAWSDLYSGKNLASRVEQEPMQEAVAAIQARDSSDVSNRVTSGP